MSRPWKLSPAIAIGGLGKVHGAQVESVREGLGSAGDVAIISVPVGQLAKWGRQKASVGVRSSVTLSADGWSLSLTVVRVTRTYSRGRQTLQLECWGTTWEAGQIYPTAVAGAGDCGPFNVPGRWMSEDGTAFVASGARWTQKAMLTALLDGTGIVLTCPDGLLLDTPTIDCRGMSLLSAIGAIIDGRGACWRLWNDGGIKKLSVFAMSGTRTVDLRGPWITEVSATEDGSATVSGMTVQGGQHVTVKTLASAITGSSITGDLARSGTVAGGVVLRMQDFTLADGTTSARGHLLSSLPVSDGGTSCGEALSTSIRAFVRAAADGKWSVLSAGVQVMPDGQTLIVTPGTDTGLQGFDMLRLTVAVVSGSPVKATFSGGVGLATTRRDSAGMRVVCDSSIAWTVSAAGALITASPGNHGPTPTDLTTTHTAAWTWASQDRANATWTEVGSIGAGPAPGTLVSALTLPDGTTLDRKGIVTSRDTRWTGRTFATTTTLGMPEV